MSSNYNPSMTPAQSNVETEKAELQRVILDASARRFQAHRIYLRVAAARRWAINRQNILRGQQPGSQHAAQLKTVSNTFRQVSKTLSVTIIKPLADPEYNKRKWLK